jgi:hypothetical protein
MKPRKLIFSLLSLGILASLAQALGLVQLNALTPEQAAQNNYNFCTRGSKSPFASAPQSFRIVGKRKLEKGVVLFYTGVCSNPDKNGVPEQLFGSVRMIRTGLRWSPRDGFAQGSAKLSPPQTNLVNYNTTESASVGESDNLYLFPKAVYGQALSSKVVAVEAIFKDGQVQRSEIANGVFGLVAPQGQSTCELRVLDGNNQVLRVIKVSLDKRTVGASVLVD